MRHNVLDVDRSTTRAKSRSWDSFISFDEGSISYWCFCIIRRNFFFLGPTQPWSSSHTTQYAMGNGRWVSFAEPKWFFVFFRLEKCDRLGTFVMSLSTINWASNKTSPTFLLSKDPLSSPLSQPISSWTRVGALGPHFSHFSTMQITHYDHPMCSLLLSFVRKAAL